MTGWAQVRYGYANSLEEEMEKIRYDLYYIKHHSFWLDLRIVFATLRTILLGRSEIGPAAPPVEANGHIQVLGSPESVSDGADNHAAAFASVRGLPSQNGAEPAATFRDIR
jgi:hypothetical protein